MSAVNLCHSQKGLEDTADTLTGEETCGDGEHVHVVAGRAALRPVIVEDGACTHGNGVEGLRNEEGDTNGVPVGNEDPVLLGDPEVLNHDGDGSEDGEADGGVTR